MDDIYDDDPCPCDSCNSKDSCDGWEARYCCRLCLWHNEDPNCDDCDSMDI